MTAAAPSIHTTSSLGADVRVGDGASIGPGCHLEGHVTVGQCSRLVGGLFIVGPVAIGDHCLIEPCVAFTDIAEARSLQSGQAIIIGDEVEIGAGAVISYGVRVGRGARVMAGSVVTRDIPAHAIVSGHPAAITGYTNARTREAGVASVTPVDEVGVSRCLVKDAAVYTFRRIRDLRGDLCAGEFLKTVPFSPKRYFLVFDVPSAETRGEHAHKQCKQFLICVKGSISVVIDDAVTREEIQLSRPNVGLYLPEGIWGIQYKYSRDAVLLVFASEFYDASDYIRDYDDFIAWKAAGI